MTQFKQMDRQDLARYVVAHRDTPEGKAAWQEFCRRFTARAEAKGIDLHRPPIDSETQH